MVPLAPPVWGEQNLVRWADDGWACASEAYSGRKRGEALARRSCWRDPPPAPNSGGAERGKVSGVGRNLSGRQSIRGTTQPLEEATRDLRRTMTPAEQVLWQEYGYRVLRFTNEQVLNDLDTVMDQIAQATLDIPTEQRTRRKKPTIPEAAVPFTP